MSGGSTNFGLAFAYLIYAVADSSVPNWSKDMAMDIGRAIRSALAYANGKGFLENLLPDRIDNEDAPWKGYDFNWWWENGEKTGDNIKNLSVSDLNAIADHINTQIRDLDEQNQAEFNAMDSLMQNFFQNQYSETSNNLSTANATTEQWLNENGRELKDALVNGSILGKASTLALLNAIIQFAQYYKEAESI
jgi:hypothetical protein